MPRWIIALVALVVIFLLLQLIPVESKRPAEIPADDFIVYANMPIELADNLRVSCYPCHSYNVTEPSFPNKLFPFSYFHEQRLQAGRTALNYAEWTNYLIGDQFHKMEATVKVLRQGHDDFNRYVGSNPEAYWNADEYRMMLEYFENWKDALQ